MPSGLQRTPSGADPSATMGVHVHRINFVFFV
jgi:hypothetical protein